MRIAVVSNDASLLVLCEDVLGKLPGEQHDIVLVQPDQAVEADVYLWDMDLRPRIPEQRSGRDVFLVRRAALGSFLDRNPHAGPNTLLKPVSPAALEVCFTHLFRPAKSAESVPDKFREDRDTLLECLFHSSLRLQEFEEDRTNFWARAAHDLRAPLTAASGYCGLLLDAQIGPLNAHQHELLKRVQHSLTKLNRMASAMFQLTAGRQLEGKHELKRTDMEELINRSADEVRIFAAEKKISLDIDFTTPDHPLYVEPNQMEQVLVNLLENACKFTPRNGQIRIRAYPVIYGARTGRLNASSHHSAYRVDISDSGPGIPPEHLPHIFEEYVTYGTPANRSGGGLGLAICKMILHAHRGEIWTESGDKGTTFSFVLPFDEPVTHEIFSIAAAKALDEHSLNAAKELG